MVQTGEFQKKNVLRVKSEKGEKLFKVDEIHSILFPKMECFILKLEVSSSTEDKLKHFVRIPSTDADMLTYNEVVISTKIKSFDINEDQLQKCWLALKCGQWKENDGVGIKK